MADVNLLEILRCPTLINGARCDGAFAGEAALDSVLTCGKCGRKVPRVQGIPVFHENAVSIHYDGNYKARTRRNDVEHEGYRWLRETVARWVKDLNVVGPSLDVGCGTAVCANILPKYVGLDYSLEAVVNSDPDLFSFVCGSASELPFKSGTFNCVFSSDALEHVPAIDVAFEEIDRVIAPGGVTLLKPAWHCTRAQTELIPIKKYGELDFRQKVVKFTLPLQRTKLWKFATHFPSRVLRHAFASRPTRLSFSELTPNYSQWIADSDAAASVDCHEGLLFFLSRGYEPISHPTLKSQLLAGHDFVVLRKPAKV